MEKPPIMMKKKLIVFLIGAMFALGVMIFRLGYLHFTYGELWSDMAYEQQTRDRLINATRGSILDRNSVGIALNETVNSISVIPVQVNDVESTATFLSEKLELEYSQVLEKIQQNVALVRIKSNVDVDLANEIRSQEIEGVMIDEDVKRVYPYSEMASQVIGFVGSDNQGILGLD